MEAKYTGNVYHLPLPRGEFSVGVADVYASNENGSFFRLYYPVKTVAGRTHWSPWDVGLDQSSNMANFYSGPMIRRCLTPIIKYQTKDAQVPAGWCLPPYIEKSCPVAVITHGYGASRGFFSTLACDLASHGYIVAVISHNEMSCVSSRIYKDGNIENVPFINFKRNTKQLDERVEEIFQLMDDLDSLNKGQLVNLIHDEVNNCCMESGLSGCCESSYVCDHFKSKSSSSQTENSITNLLKGKLDLNQTVIIGHSFGGSTALAVINDLRQKFVTSVILDPWMYPVKQSILSWNLAHPSLIITTEQFDTGANNTSLQAFVDRVENNHCQYWTIKGSHHLHGNDSPWLMGLRFFWLVSGVALQSAQVFTQLHHDLIFCHLNKYIDCDTLKVNDNFINLNLEQLIKKKEIL